MNPVKGAEVSYVVIYPDGTSLPTNLFDVATGADGILKIALPVSMGSPRQVVEVQLTVKLQELRATTRTWYRIWY